MKTIRAYPILVLLLAISAVLWHSPAWAEEFETSSLRIKTPTGQYGFVVEMAVTSRQREQGLQNRTEMAADRGMLFDFRSPVYVVMWMKNTHISLDMLFINETGRIVRIAEKTEPHSLNRISSEGRVRAVLELVAGSVERIGARVGDHVLHPIFNNGHHKE